MTPPNRLAEVLLSVVDIIDPFGERQPITVHSRAADDDTPLHTLAWREDTEGVKVLIAAGADVNALGDMSVTPLHVAVSNQNAEMIRIFLQAGADPDIVDEFGRQALPDSIRGVDLIKFFADLKGKQVPPPFTCTSPIWPPQQPL